MLSAPRPSACVQAASEAVRGHQGTVGAAARPVAPRFKLRVLRAKCIDCANGAEHATACDMADCPLHTYRTGQRPKGKATLAPMTALRARCLDCTKGDRRDVQRCDVAQCPLWPWRRGRSHVGELPPQEVEHA